MNLAFSNNLLAAYLTEFVRSFQAQYPNGFLGRTAMQKLVYFGKSTGVPVPCSYEIYNYGPYSDQVTFKTDGLLADEILTDTSSSSKYSNYRLQKTKVPFSTDIEICTRFTPSLIVTRLVRQADRRYRTRARVRIQRVKTAASKLAIPVKVVSTSSLVGHFSRGDKISKYERARMVAARFPELAWRLPPKRKAWQSELKRTTMFDAASIGMFHFAQPR